MTELAQVIFGKELEFATPDTPYSRFIWEVLNLIAGTTTKTGLIVKAALDTNQYATEIKVSDEELAGLCLERHEFHGDWNYTISPRPKRTRSKKL